jgi:hypothetical protein
MMLRAGKDGQQCAQRPDRCRQTWGLAELRQQSLLFSPGPWWYIYAVSLDGPSGTRVPVAGSWMHLTLPATRARETAMARIRHIALTTKDPEKTAAFYMQAFDMREVSRSPNGSLHLTDGYIDLL